MANIRGVDVLGQGFASGIQNLLQSLGQQYEQHQRQVEAMKIAQGLLNNSRDRYGYSSNLGAQAVDPNAPQGNMDLNSLNVPAERPQFGDNKFVTQQGTPIFSEPNFMQLSRLAAVDPNAVPILKMLQRKFETIAPGSVYGSVNPEGQFTEQGVAGFRPTSSSSKPTTFWSDVIDQESGLPTVDSVAGRKMVKQTRLEMNPVSGAWEQKYQWVPADKTSGGSGKPQRMQLVYTNEGFKGYDPYSNTWKLITGEAKPKWKLAPSEARTMETSLQDTISTIKSIRDIVNRGSKIGPIVGRVNKFGTKFFNNADFETLKARTGQLRAVIYGLSGKQINESEQEWLYNEIVPTLEQPAENFDARLSELERWSGQRSGKLHGEYPELNRPQKSTSSQSDKKVESKFEILQVK
jgi:hypothetical protein